jgi:hypothetical protein
LIADPIQRQLTYAYHKHKHLQLYFYIGGIVVAETTMPSNLLTTPIASASSSPSSLSQRTRKPKRVHDMYGTFLLIVIVLSGLSFQQLHSHISVEWHSTDKRGHDSFWFLMISKSNVSDSVPLANRKAESLLSTIPFIDRKEREKKKGESTTSTTQLLQPASELAVEDTTVYKYPNTVAYAISLTSWNKKKMLSSGLLDGAAVLRQSVHFNSIRNPESGSRYDYHMIAFVHPEAAAAQTLMEQLGYTVLIRETPLNVSEIRNPEYVERLVSKGSGCCGEKEFLKLYSLTLLDYPVVVHLDLDSLLLKPLDELVDVMKMPAHAVKHIPLAMWNKTVTHSVTSMFTRDYPAGHPGLDIRQFGMQGGFWMVKPDLNVFEELLELIRQGQFTVGAGWGTKEYYYSGFYGAAQIQGLLQYYYGEFHPDKYVELNRCYINQMVDDPHDSRFNNTCYTHQDPCPDCRTTPVSEVYSAHFTFCQKPWWCPSWHTANNESKHHDYRQAPLCQDLHHVWHKMRFLLEQSWGLNVSLPEHANDRSYADDYTYGYCHHKGLKVMGEYKFMEVPL